MRAVRVQDLLGLINRLFPVELAEDWDNVGLQVGDPAAPVDRVLVALDPESSVVAAACDKGAQVLVTHHPLLFKPLRRLSPDDPVGRSVWAAIQGGVSIIAAHTNLDVAADGLNQWFAQRLELVSAEPLQPISGHLFKLVVFVPVDHGEEVSQALFNAGAGQVGAYDHCSFQVGGVGTFRPGPGTTPFIGNQGRDERVQEVRLETVVTQRRLSRVLERMVKAHPYEEVAYDLIPLSNHLPGCGLGRLGKLQDPLTLSELGDKVKASLDCQALRLVGQPEQIIHKVAVCGGSGTSLLYEAYRRGADVLITGDVKYHEARQAEALGLALIDAGHFATERLAIEELAFRIGQEALIKGWNLDIIVHDGEHDPFIVR